MKINQKGFSVVEVLIVFIVLGLIGGAGWYVWKKNNDTKPANTQNSEQNKQTSNGPTPDEYTNWKTYTSTKGGFSFKYPNDWVITGFKGANTVEAANLKGDEDQLRITQKNEAESKVDNFGVNLSVGPTLPSDGGMSDLSKFGAINKLTQDISVLDEYKEQTWASGAQKNDCPTIRVVADNHIGMKLRNGKYLDFTGGYCWGEGLTTSLSFDDQKIKKSYQDTLLMLKSFTYN